MYIVDIYYAFENKIINLSIDQSHCLDRKKIELSFKIRKMYLFDALYYWLYCSLTAENGV